MTPRAWFGIAVLACLGSYGAGRLGAPSREESRVVMVEKVRLQDVVRETVKTVAIVQKQVGRTENYERKTKPDGTVEETGQIVYREQSQEQTAQQLAFSLDHTEQRDTKREETKIVTHDGARLNVFVGAGVSTSLTSLDVAPQYVAGFQYQAMGPLGVGAWGTFEQSVKPRAAGGLLVGLRF